MQKLGIIILLIVFIVIGRGLCAEEIIINNGGTFSLEAGQAATLKFKGFSDREISLISLDSDSVTIKSLDDIYSFGNETEDLSSKRKTTFSLKVGKEIISYETEEMLVVLKLQAIEDKKAVLKITYHTEPPAPAISSGEKIKILYNECRDLK